MLLPYSFCWFGPTGGIATNSPFSPVAVLIIPKNAFSATRPSSHASFAFGTAYITSEQGPGSPLGNLYYFTWGCFLSSFLLCSSLYDDYNAAKSMGGGDNNDLAMEEGNKTNGAAEDDQI